MATEKHSERPDDLPKTAARIILIVPPLVVKVAFRYLAMKRRVRKSARVMEAELKASGMPEHLAHRLSIRYEENSRFIEMIFKKFINRESLSSLARSANSKTGN